jgi:dephospho-CoA kinase
MSAWPDKFVIGLSGNIATGKSVTRKMLEHLGAFGIDADALAHRAIAQGSPGYDRVLDSFGKSILGSTGKIDRSILGKIVFNDPQLLQLLEQIVHPLVGGAINRLIQRSSKKIVVIEAIKLIESKIGSNCDTIWVTFASQKIQLARLWEKRGMDEAIALQRINQQPPQEEKVSLADVVIQNIGSLESVWQQVSYEWDNLVVSNPSWVSIPPPIITGDWTVQPTTPEQAGKVAHILTKLSDDNSELSRQEIMSAYGVKTFVILDRSQKPSGIAGWKTDNLVAITDDIFIDKTVEIPDAFQTLVSAIELMSSELLCDGSLLFLPPKNKQYITILEAMKYSKCSIQDLNTQTWQEIAKTNMPGDSVMFFKPLHQDLLLWSP